MRRGVECAGVRALQARCTVTHLARQSGNGVEICPVMCPLLGLAGATRKVSAQLVRSSCLALALASCLPSSGDLGQYSADWSPPPPELEQQMALPNQATNSPVDPSQSSSSATGYGTSSTGSGDSSSSASAEPPGSNSEQPPTLIVQQTQSGSGPSTAEPAASDPPSSDPAPTDP